VTRARTRLTAAIVCLLAVGAHRAPSAATDPLLVLVSFDGWRWDYTDRPEARRLRALAARGVRVREMIPSFPVLTFPNHYTIVTGLYPEHHGIVGNSFIDPRSRERFSMTTTQKTNPMWWGGEPIWNTAGRQGLRTAAVFWPGSEGEIRGMRPTLWRAYDGKLPAAGRIDLAIEWLRLPAAERPSLLAVYLEDVDHAGHDYGPDSPELTRAAALVDQSLGRLVDAIHALHLDDRTTIVVVSDHGMTAVSQARAIWLEDYSDITRVDVTDWEGTVLITPKDGKPETVHEIFERLQHAHPRLHVFTRETLPARLHYSNNERIAPIVGIPDDGWMVTTRARVAQRREEGRPPVRGAHGYVPADRTMHALFVAAGPDVRRGLTVPNLRNIDVYDFLCRVLRIAPAPNDGNAEATAGFFRR
jgi:predicted AlkP superfamily pyrophosphatase or phosphodiesterase